MKRSTGISPPAAAGAEKRPLETAPPRSEGRPAAIDLRDVRKSFEGKRVLDGISLRIRKGETLAVLGPSGGGKTVLLKHLVGLLKPDAGRVEVAGVDLAAVDLEELNEVRTRIGYLFQGAALLNSLTVFENVALPMRERGDSDEENLAKEVAERLDWVGLKDSGDKLPAELSGGMRKRAGLARALMGRPEILLYDEPTSGLDPPGAAGIGDLILRLQERLGVTSVVVTHDIDLAFRVSNRLAMLKDGAICKLGSPDEFRNSEDPGIRSFITPSVR